MRTALGLVFLLATSLHAGNDKNSSFPSTTMESFAKDPSTQEVMQSTASYSIDSAMPGLAVVFQYTGRERAIPVRAQMLIDTLGKAFQSPAFSKAYVRQILVKEGKKEYWITIQQSHHHRLPKALRPGKSFVARMRLGGQAKGELVFLLMEFVAPAGSRSRQPASIRKPASRHK